MSSVNKKWYRDPAIRQNVAIVMSIDDACTGVSLVATTHIIFTQPCINPEVEFLVIGRAQQIGRIEEVQVEQLYWKSTIEEQICKLRAEKIPTHGRFTDPILKLLLYNELPAPPTNVCIID